jgi:acetyl esterase/lipase
MGSSAPPLKELNLPPLLLCIAENDLVIDTEMAYYEAMKKAEVKWSC